MSGTAHEKYLIFLKMTFVSLIVSSMLHIYANDVLKVASVKINFRFYVNLRVPSSYQQTMPCLVLHSSSGGLCRKVPQLTQEGRGT